MRRSKTSVRLLSWLLFAAGLHCSAGGAPGSVGVAGDGSGNAAPVVPPGGVPPAAGAKDPAFLIGDQGDAIDANGNPINIGSEAACDGVDENDNGIIDDVDKGKDGLCDCLHIGFLGGLA